MEIKVVLKLVRHFSSAGKMITSTTYTSLVPVIRKMLLT